MHEIFSSADGSTYKSSFLIHNHHGRKEKKGSEEDCKEGSEEGSQEGRKEAQSR